MILLLQEDKTKERKVQDQYIKPLKPKTVKLKMGDKVEARSAKKEQRSREGGRSNKLSIGSKGTKSPMVKNSGDDGDSDDEEGGNVGIGSKKTPSSSSSSSPTKYSSAAKEEPVDADTNDEEEGETAEQKKNDDDQESKDLINSFKSMTGTGTDTNHPSTSNLVYYHLFIAFDINNNRIMGRHRSTRFALGKNDGY